jgi:hypothetical protein
VFKLNLITNFGVATIFFLIFLYLVGSVAATIAPSGVDLKHAMLGMFLLFLIGLIAIYSQPLSYLKDGWTTPVLDWIVGHMMSAIGIGIMGAVIFLIPLGLIAMLKK